MPPNNPVRPEELYQQGLQHFNRADWRGAIAAFTQLQSISDQYPDVDDLLADARLKLHFEGTAEPVAMAPPKRRIWVPLLLGLLVLLTVGAGGYYYYYLMPPPVVAIAPTPVPPSPTATITPTATVEPTPSPTPAPTATAAVPGTVVVRAADNTVLVSTPKNIEIIIDASGSMLAQSETPGKQRWQVAQEALTALVNSNTISDQSFVAVRTYGRRQGNDCNDLELVQGLSRFNPAELNNVISGIKPAPGGMTPLGASLREASTDLQAAEGGTVVILVTDGLESCNGDPVAEANNFVTGSNQRKVHVIGFALDDPVSSETLRKIADSGKGLYFDAGNATQLAEALRQTIVLSYRISTPEGEEVATGTVGDPALDVAPGRYKLEINANPPVEKELVVKNGDEVVVSLREGFGGIIAEIETKTQ